MKKESSVDHRIPAGFPFSFIAIHTLYFISQMIKDIVSRLGVCYSWFQFWFQPMAGRCTGDPFLLDFI